MGLEAARTILETGGDVICLDRQDEPLAEPWSMHEHSFILPSATFLTPNIY